MEKHCYGFIHNYSKRKEFYMRAFTRVSSKLLTKTAFFLCSSQKHEAPRGQRHPRLVIEECPLTYETLTNEVVKELLEKVMEVFSKFSSDFCFCHPFKLHLEVVVLVLCISYSSYKTFLFGSLH